MKVRYIIDTAGHSKGDIINLDGYFANGLVKSGVCELVTDTNNIPSKKVEAPIHKDVLDAPEVVVPKKKKGNPNFGKKK